jgi:hypothetical protein
MDLSFAHIGTLMDYQAAQTAGAGPWARCGNKPHPGVETASHHRWRNIVLAFRTSRGEIALLLDRSDAKWLSEEMSFLSELYRSKTSSSERQFGGDNNPASSAFWDTALKCQRLSVTLQTAVDRGHHQQHDAGDPTATTPLHLTLATPGPAASAESVKRETRPKRPRRTGKGRTRKRVRSTKKKKSVLQPITGS